MGDPTASQALPTLTKDMLVREIVALCPASADIMAEYGMHCFSCALGGSETLEEGGRIHGFEPEVIDALLEDINDALARSPKRPLTITVTEAAARALREIAEAEGKLGQSLAVTVDEAGGFCMEFREENDAGDLVFCSAAVPDMLVTASVLTLSRIGGATIDMQDGRFKLDVPENSSCCKEGGACSCKGE